MDSKKLRSYLLLSGAMLIFGTIGIFRKNLPVSSEMLAFFRGITGAAVILPYALIRREKLIRGTEKRDIILFVVSGAFIGVNWILLFEAYNRTTVAVATLCYYMAPTVVVLLSPLILKEKLTVKKTVCALISVLGMVLVSGIIGGDSHAGNAGGVLFGLGAAALYASVMIVNKFMRTGTDFGKTVIQLLSASLTLLPYLLLSGKFETVPLTGSQTVMLVILGVVHTGIAYLMFFSGIRDLSAQSAAVLSYIDPVSALVFASVFMSEKMTLHGIIGAVLIIGASLVSEIGLPKKHH